MRWLLGGFLLLASLAPAGRSLAHTQPKARIALHAQPHVRTWFQQCVPTEEGGVAPTHLPCSQFEAAGELKAGYDVYLVVAGIDSVTGLAGASFGLDYDDRWGEGVDILSWYGCAELEVNGRGPNGLWPAAQSGNMLLWPTTESCQRRAVPGYESEGGHAIGGTFYVFAYGPDTLRITPNTTRVGLPRLSIADCEANETELQEEAIGSVVFGEEGKGCNPCLGPCAPIPDCDVEPTRIDFGSVPVGSAALASFAIHNNGPGTLRGIVAFDCRPEFYLLQGGGHYALGPGETHKVTLAFLANSTERKTCTQYVANRCQTILLVGQGVDPRQDAEEDLRSDAHPSDRFQRVRFRLPVPGPVRLLVFDVSGRRRYEVESEGKAAGWNELTWDAGGLPGGVYFYRLEHAGGTLQSKFLLLR